MKNVFLYAGQGSQKVGMGKDFYEQFETYKNIVDSFSFEFDHKKMMFEGPLEELSKTEYTQPCMGIFAAGVTQVLKENNILPDAACGLSLGEYGALYAAGVFSLEDYVNTLKFRGNAMMEAAKGQVCSMSAILGTDVELVKEACEANATNGYVIVVNYNCPGQYVICGDEGAVAATEEYLKAKGAKRCVRLNVSGPFHTVYMKPAGDELEKYFKTITISEPNIPVVLNYTGDFYDGKSSLSDLLVKQVQNSVHLEDSLRKLIDEGAERFIEVGPGSTLAGFLKKTAKAMGKDVVVNSIETVEDLNKLLAELN